MLDITTKIETRCWVAGPILPNRPMAQHSIVSVRDASEVHGGAVGYCRRPTWSRVPTAGVGRVISEPSNPPRTL